MSSEKDPAVQTIPASVMQGAIRDVREWLDLKMRTGRYTSGLAFELVYHMVTRCYNVHNIYDEIGILEGNDTRLSQTKSPEDFKEEPLIGFWRKHHFQPYFLAKNLINELKDNQFSDSVMQKYIGQDTDQSAGSLAHDLIIGGYCRRSARHSITGEWIVYEIDSEGRNHYLALGSHPNGADRKAHYRALRDKIEIYKRMDQQAGSQA